MTAVMRLAEARRAASTICRCSKMASLIDRWPLAPWLWMMKTSMPRTDSPKRQWISPLEKSSMLASPSSTPRQPAISSARGRLARPDTRCSFFLVISSIDPLPRLPAAAASTGPSSVERPCSGPGTHPRPRLEHRVGPYDGVVADLGVGGHGLAHDAPLADPGVAEPRRRADLTAGAHRGGAPQDGAGEQRDVGR